MIQAEPHHVPQDDQMIEWDGWGEAYDYLVPRRGDVRDGLVVKVRPDEVIVNIGAKHDAVVPSRELQRLSPEELDALHPGNTIKVYVIRASAGEEDIIVSVRLAREYEDWEWVQGLLDSGEIIQAVVASYNKGGVVCMVRSLQGFVPASQLVSLGATGYDAYSEEAFAALIGAELPLKVIEVNRRRRRLILSERAAQREWRAQQREVLMAELEEGQVRRGLVSSLRDFGAFVDLGGADGLVHLSEISWSRIKHPGEVLRVGDEVEVLVLRVDPQEQRIGLSLKRLQPDPWDEVQNRYGSGSIVRGTVTHLAKFGAFVELEPGIEGLIHISELAAGNISDPATVVTEGQELDLLILDVNASRHRISLSLRQATSPSGSQDEALEEDDQMPAQDTATDDEMDIEMEA